MLDALCAALAELLDVLDVRKLKPGKLLAVLNSTPLGECITSSKLTRHRQRAGLRIGDDKTIDLVRYAAWLAINRARLAAGTPDSTSYEAHRVRMAQVQREKSLAARDIGELPAVADPERREAAYKSLRAFCDTYLSRVFYLPWSADHIAGITTIERTARDGGTHAFAMPRGFGKTMLCEAAAIWCLLFRVREYVAIFGPSQKHAMDRVESIKSELEGNDLLLADFPEVCFPIRRLEGIYQRRLMFAGRPIRQQITATSLILANLSAEKYAGCIIEAAGLTGQIRGMNFKREDGTSIRPSFVLLDDPQTDEQAHSPAQVAKLDAIIRSAVLGLAGPGRPISAVMPCTVIAENDLADQYLDRERNPQWQGRRTKMLRSLPSNEDLWAQYAKLRRQGQAIDVGGQLGNEHYAANRAAMDAGADASWDHRFDAGEVSAIQHAMNIKIDRGDRAFFAECQNEPMPEIDVDDDLLTAAEIAAKLNGHARRAIPAECSLLTMFVDVQDKALFWLVAAWDTQFGGHVVDYGTEPDQRTGQFTLREIKRTLAQVAPRAGVEGAIRAGLDRLTNELLAREWRRDDGAMMRIDRCLVDANYMTEVVYQFARQTPHFSVLMPSHGRYVGATSRPFDEYSRRPGERVGLNWRIPEIAKKRVIRHVLFDANFWKSFVHARLSVPIGDPGSLALWGRKSEQHAMFADHLTAEHRMRPKDPKGRVVDEWKALPNRDNHWFDCLVGSAVAASMAGATLEGMRKASGGYRRVSFRELQRKARERR